MAVETTDKQSKWAGIPMADGELEEYNQVWTDMEENIKLVWKNGKNI